MQTPKPGVKTSEFWVMILAEIALLLAIIAGALPDKYGATLMTVAVCAYKLSRGLAKIGPPAQLPPLGDYPPIEPPGDTTSA